MTKKILVIVMTILASLAASAQTLMEADSLHRRARELAEGGNIAEARECGLKAMDIRRQLLGEVSEDYISSLNNYAVTFMMEEDFAKAAPLLAQVISLCRQLSHPHPDFLLFAKNAGYSAYMTANYQNAIDFWEQALTSTEKFSKDYEYLLTALGLTYEETGDKQGQNRMMALMDEHNQHELTLPCDEPGCMMERARYYGTTGNHAMAKECYMKALAMPMDTATQISLYESYAQYMASTLKDWATGAVYQHKAANLRKDTAGEDGAYADGIYTAGIYYFLSSTDEGSHKSLECTENALKVFLSEGNAASAAKCHHLMGNCHTALHDYAKAKDCYMQALAYYDACDRDNDEYPKMIQRVATSEKFNKEYDAAIAHYQQALQIFEQRGMMAEYADAENGLSTCYAYAGKRNPNGGEPKYAQAVREAQIAQLDEIIAQEKESLELTEKYLGNLIYARSLGVIAGCSAMKEDYDEAVDYYNRYMKAIRRAVRDEFRLQSETERLDTWKDESTTIREIEDLLMTMPESRGDLADGMAALVYDAQLLSKGILLNSSIEFEKLLSGAADKELVEIYSRIKGNTAEIDRLRREAQTDDDLEKILSLNQTNQQLQLQLNKGCKEMDDFTRYISYDWHDVQAALADGDLCIEFAAINPDHKGNESQMVALVLTKDMPAPVAVKIWDNDAIMDFYDTALSDTISCHLMVAALEKSDIKEAIRRQKELADSSDTPYKNEISLLLNQIKHQADTATTFFIPQFLIGATYPSLIMQDDVLYDGEEVGNIVWGCLASFLKGKDRIFFSADGIFNSIGVEYLQYEGKPLSDLFEVYRLSSTKELCYSHDHSKPSKAALFGDINYNGTAISPADAQRQAGAVRGAADEDAFADLSHTLREVNDIQNILKSGGVADAERFRDTRASKEAFLRLSDSNINLLHIATHGMYKDTGHATDAESMQNSILAFAGANLDDGALVTAADIADMNLRDCDMAVLSACETGLGKLGNDGVFGLQRGFKNAGVHTLLMSLKNVYDESTADLMISFYRHLMNGSTKREALVKAQQEIRAKGFSDPKYWATFILLDAI